MLERGVPPQTTDTVVTISPDQFGFNSQTAETNVFQNDPNNLGSTEAEVRDAALGEFDSMMNTLSKHDITVLTLPTRSGVLTPDAVFPNNWFSTHSDGRLVLYPMLAENRRAERQVDALQGALSQVHDISFPDLVDFTSREKEGKILEGTGSLVLDRQNKVAFAMESPRTSEDMFNEWCRNMGYEGVFFHAYDKESLPIYHTNVVMSIGEQFAVWCPESIKDAGERFKINKKFAELDKESIPITQEQLNRFSGNILQLDSKRGDSKIIMSTSAYDAFTPLERIKLDSYGEIVPVNIPTIEQVGGGSARCMLAEVFTPDKQTHNIVSLPSVSNL